MDPFRLRAGSLVDRTLSGLSSVHGATDAGLRSIRMLDEIVADLSVRGSRLLDQGSALELAETNFLLEDAAAAKIAIASALYTATDVAVQELDKRLRLTDALLKAQMRAATETEQAALRAEGDSASHRTRRGGHGSTPTAFQTGAAAASIARLAARSAADASVVDSFEPRYCSCNQVSRVCIPTPLPVRHTMRLII